MLIKPYAVELVLVIVGLAAATPVVLSQTASSPAAPSAPVPAAQAASVPEGRAASAAPRPKPKTVLGTRYLCGGIGKEEADDLRQQAQDYDLMLTFTAHDRSYLADVGIEIRDEKGRSMLQTRCDGPILLVDLPQSGSYRIRAEANHQPLSRTVTVPRKKRSEAESIVLSWPAQPAHAAGPARSSGGAGSGR